MSLFGDILKVGIDTVALPVKIVEAGAAKMVGENRDGLNKAMPLPSNVADKLKEIIEDADEE